MLIDVTRATRHNRRVDCRPRCAACCEAPSISSLIPGMTDGKPAGVPCAQLLSDRRCALFGDPRRPPVCVSLRPTPAMCGRTRGQALRVLARLERQTAPRAAPAR